MSLSEWRLLLPTVLLFIFSFFLCDIETMLDMTIIVAVPLIVAIAITFPPINK